ncbi:MAG: TlyA family RNA methyltransferase [Actinomycetota bacterium]|nr:TlyA family RNA methyltransferase [Actinomycetota bacterium]
MSRRRLDAEMVRRGLAENADEARRAIDQRSVVVDGAPAMKAGSLVEKDSRIRVERPRRFVSRGGEKLQGALEDLGIDVAGKRCLDAGAGSGGFTDCLLQRGAECVVAVDVGYGQFDWTLRRNPRVRLLERTNIRHLPIPGLAGSFDLVVGDLSFVTLRSLVPTLVAMAREDGTLLLLVKPQFEVPPRLVGAGGVITDPAAWQLAVESVADGLQEAGWAVVAVTPSRLRGADGNQEFFLEARRGVGRAADAISKAVASLS